MVAFADLKFEETKRRDSGVKALHKFANGYSASVIRTPHSYGGEEGLYELAVRRGNSLDYTTPVTDDVEGWLSEDDVTRLLREIEALPAAPDEGP